MRKQNQTKVAISIQELIDSGFYCDFCQGYYEPKANDIADIYLKDNQVSISITFDTQLSGMRISDETFINRGFKRSKSMSYEKVVSFLKNKGFAIEESDCLVLAAYNERQSNPKMPVFILGGWYCETWKNQHSC